MLARGCTQKFSKGDCCFKRSAIIFDSATLSCYLDRTRFFESNNLVPMIPFDMELDGLLFHIGKRSTLNVYMPY